MNIFDHVALWNEIDGVSGGLAGEDYFQCNKTTNIKINVKDYYSQNEILDAHSFDVKHPEIILKYFTENKIPLIKIYE